MTPLHPDRAAELRAAVDDFDARRAAAGDLPGLIAAIPAEVAQCLLGSGWVVDDAGAWVSPHDGRPLPWREAIEDELGRAG